jgi:polysaccharide pyruvyl transferase WcaK-like protein
MDDPRPHAAAAPAAHPRPVLRLFNAKFSPNLGDGLLSECLEAGLIAAGADPATTSIDLAARTGFGPATPGRGALLAGLQALPGPLRRAAIGVPLRLAGARKWHPHYVAGLRGADGVVVGGGNLLADLDLNFPTKLSLALDAARAAGLPCAIYGCGMSPGWSRRGLAMMRTALRGLDLRGVFLRDAASKAAWDELLAPAAGREAVVVRDPGLLAASVHPRIPQAPGDGRPVIGIGIMSHVAIRYHSETALTEDDLTRWYLDLARALAAAGCRLRAFTNGSPEDVAYADALLPKMRALPAVAPVLEAVTQTDPQGLCDNVAGCDAIASFRLHAVIAAHAYGIPALALAWDRKVASYMASVDRPHDLVDVACSVASASADRLRILARDGLPDGHAARIANEARHGVAMLWAAMTGGSSP